MVVCALDGELLKAKAVNEVDAERTTPRVSPLCAGDEIRRWTVLTVLSTSRRESYPYHPVLLHVSDIWGDTCKWHVSLSPRSTARGRRGDLFHAKLWRRRSK